jgi:bifunctional ADP-heptose synthase (sugar kinase/adenylyltransferase)
VLGNDTLKDFVVSDLAEAGVETVPIIDKTRPTTQKNAFIAQGYRLLKVDKLDNRSVSEKILAKLCDEIKTDDADAFVFSDFRHGVFNKNTIPRLIDSIPAGKLRVADSQVASRWGIVLDFKGFDLITPNEREARFALGDQDNVIRPLALELYKKAECKFLILKLGERGIITYRQGDTSDPRAFFTVDSFVDRLIDPVGAGDALLSYATLSLAATKNETIASILGSVAAAIACEHDGNSPVSPEQVLEKLSGIEKRISYS